MNYKTINQIRNLILYDMHIFMRIKEYSKIKQLIKLNKL